MTRSEAVDVAIFASNTLLDPQASNNDAFAAFLHRAEVSLHVLEQIRDGQMG